jgi:hypothetical protein
MLGRVLVDVTEPAPWYQYFLWRWHLYLAVDFVLLAVKAGPRPRGDIIGESIPFYSILGCTSYVLLKIG